MNYSPRCNKFGWQCAFVYIMLITKFPWLPYHKQSYYWFLTPVSNMLFKQKYCIILVTVKNSPIFILSNCGWRILRQINVCFIHIGISIYWVIANMLFRLMQNTRNALLKIKTVNWVVNIRVLCTYAFINISWWHLRHKCASQKPFMVWYLKGYCHLSIIRDHLSTKELPLLF